MHYHDTQAMFLFRRDTQRADDVTILHLASLFWNSDIVGLLLDYRYNEKVGRDLPQCRDTNGPSSALGGRGSQL
ncbi:hypothetical protein BJX63DRAFT_376626 [Aspergillus granulosus]|uniref:Uncharacterized protein n=1 Tax=Aspergillus granulosus TaxID=176169 RepID=A0ABR4I400_9EURO